MSFLTRIVSNVREFYSEINAATLTGAIDVIVVEQEDGSLVASPFHVRFGKLGVLKAKEKIVDLEVNGEPVDLQMKLDDTGAAFFVEKVSDSSEVDPLAPELATSPIPEQKKSVVRRERSQLKPANLFPDNVSGTPMIESFPTFPQQVSCEVQTDIIECGVAPLLEENIELDIIKKGKLNKKRRRKKLKHSRNGSKSSMKEVMSGSATGSDIGDMFLMDDVNDADQEEEGDNDECILSSSVPRSFVNSNSFESSLSLNRTEFKRTDSLATQSEDLILENSLIGSRVPLIPKSSSEAEALAALLDHEEDFLIDEEIFRPKSVAAGFHYFSDGELGDTAHSTPRPMTPGGVLSDSEFENNQRRTELEHEVWRWGEVPNTSQTSASLVQNKVEDGDLKDDIKDENLAKEQKGWFRGWVSGSASKAEKSKTEKKEGGIYLEELINDPEKMSHYLNPISSLPEAERLAEDSRGVSLEREEDAESGAGCSVPMSPYSGRGAGRRLLSRNYESDGELQDLPSLISRHLPDLAASLCGGLESKDVTVEAFENCLLTYTEFMGRLREGGESMMTDPRLVIRVHEKYLSWAAASPILLSILLFKQPLPGDLIQELIKDGLDVNLNLSPEEVEQKRAKTSSKSSTWFGWFSGNRPKENSTDKLEEQETHEETPIIEVVDTAESSCQTELNSSSIPIPKFDENSESVKEASNTIIVKDEIELEDEDPESKGRYRKTLRLSSERLAALNLVPGSNEVEFSVTTAFQGTSRCLCHIYKWHHKDKVVISDIDGTITKSDVLGHILPVIGRDWAQSGVARLFSKITNNGYHIMYLSARAIGQASITKDYLQSVKQGDMCLPDGPVFLNPDSLIHAFRREVIDRNPEEFKIRCLKDIQSLFEGKNPFFAGYGNRPNDAFAYAAVGIPVSRIFTINPAGELRHELTQNFQTSYVEQDLMVDQVFPPIGVGFDPEFKIQEFASFGFWREVPLEVDVLDMDHFLNPEEETISK